MKFVVHRIVTQQHSGDVHLTTSDAEATFDADINKDELLVDLLNLFESRGVSFGEFKEHSPFEAAWEGSIDEEGNIDLVGFSKSRMEVLKEVLETRTASTGGYIWFILYNDDAGAQKLMVLMLDDKSGLHLEYDDGHGAYKVNKITHLDLDKLHIGVNIDWNAHSLDQEKYLKFKKAKSANFAKYFYDDLVQARLVGGPMQDTTALASFVKDYLTENFEDATERMETLYEWFENNSVVSLASVAAQIYPDSEEMQAEFVNEATENQIPEEIEIDKASAKLLRTYKVNLGSVSVKFNAGDLSETVKINKNEKTLMIENIPQDQLDQFPD